MNRDEDIQNERRRIEEQLLQRTRDEIEFLNREYRGRRFQFEFKGDTKGGIFVTAKLADSPTAINYEIYLLVPAGIVTNGVCSILDSQGQRISAMIQTKIGPKENGVMIFATLR
jgi:hypothetical protein